MWLFVPRPPKPDAAYWPGRSILAVVDALVWPALIVAAVLKAPATGLVGAFLIVLAATVALRRTFVALTANHRYRFTTWKLGFIALAILAVAALSTVRF